ncbi:unnamed protein product [Rangifer tarandus platyrhynchus]|uniref:Uncharacterized protein n=2 Tax=Rangifer tarandus platyrhynchus TaxID=3082113 RepID=A0ACB0DTW7_RANTA|nr:unnamed protein product [Rangifer tarandus platyrhynchus]CAI9691727.1 unnamed protein product [Rangifer tarandus platyrhynchus]
MRPLVCPRTLPRPDWRREARQAPGPRKPPTGEDERASSGPEPEESERHGGPWDAGRARGWGRPEACRPHTLGLPAPAHLEALSGRALRATHGRECRRLRPELQGGAAASSPGMPGYGNLHASCVRFLDSTS